MNHPHIMVATDLLPKSRPALERGAILARALGANVTLVHVVPVEPWEEQAAERSRDALEQMTQLAQDPIWTGVVQLDTLGVVLVGAGLMSADDLDRLRLRWRRGAASPTLRFS